MKHVDLFSGIGGFALAAKWTGFETVVFCEKDEFCQKVLQKRFGGFIADSKIKRLEGRTRNRQEKTNSRSRQGNGIPIIPEIRDFDGTKWNGATLLTGGFPCQPFSVAGKRKGKEDDRYLWPEMLRVIKEAKPRWILAENVAGIFKMALDTVLADLESEGYTTGTVVIPAAGVNAPHRRDRIWIIGNSNTIGCNWNDRKKREIQNQNPNMHRGDDNAPNSPDKRRGAIQKPEQSKGNTGRETAGNADGDAPDSDRFNGNDARFSTSKIPFIEKAEIQGCNSPDSQSRDSRKPTEQKRGEDSSGGSWEIPWIEVATRFCRVDDGVPNRMDRLKSLGNAIVPQVAAEIMKGIMMIEENK